jgi:predicted GNAT family N-acyltransferase
MNTKVIQVLTEKQKDDLMSLYREAWWACDRTAKDVDKALANSSFYIGIVNIENDQLIGFARVLTDYFQFSYIYDVIVHKVYRGHGLGKQLIETILNHPSLKDIKHIELVCGKDKISFYNQFGFTEDYGQSVAMRIKRD